MRVLARLTLVVTLRREINAITLALLLTRLESLISILISYRLPKSATKGNLFTALISLPRLIGSYTSNNVIQLITDVIIKYFIEENISALIIDNVKDNGKLIETIIVIFLTIDLK